MQNRLKNIMDRSDTSDLGATLLLHAIPLLVTEFPVIESAVIEILSVSPFMRIK